ncbi:unnamed protein product [Arctia plantaginis]|uniref:Uncharacterized protein n=1 Tax=Arctia plantaginis TaxID=874455 RepID=A0A8S1BCW4_ARCPL|nr:unnamed protein product [Arctia plantaginis]CAB3256773.1 unnamed protein product [Arctia plantaginis]
MISNILFFIATLCIVNASVNTIYDADGLSISADSVNGEPGNFDLNLNEDVEGLSITADTVNDESENFGLNFNEVVEESPMGIAGLKLDSSESPSEERIRICNSNICNRVCRIVNLRGKCVKKRCRCLPRALSMLDQAGLMVDEEVENPNLITEE